MQTKNVAGQSNIVTARNYFDDQGNPAGGYAHGVGFCVSWQDGPRGKQPDGSLAPANGAFVEDLLVAVAQRLAFFQSTQYAHEANAEAMRLVNTAIETLAERARERANRGVLGQNAV